MPRIPTSPRTLCRIARWSAAVALLTLVAIGASMVRDASYVRASGWFVGIAGGCLRTGHSDYLRSTDPGWCSEPAWHPAWAFAWRPFHVQTGMGDRYWTTNYLAFPLWPLAGASVIACVWARTSLRTLTAHRTSSCPACGYDLSASPITNHQRRCPECGRQHHAAPSIV